MTLWLRLWIWVDISALRTSPEAMQDIIFLRNVLFLMQEMHAQCAWICPVNISVAQHNLYKFIQIYASAKEVHVCLAVTGLWAGSPLFTAWITPSFSSKSIPHSACLCGLKFESQRELDQGYGMDGGVLPNLIYKLLHAWSDLYDVLYCHEVETVLLDSWEVELCVTIHRFLAVSWNNPAN